MSISLAHCITPKNHFFTSAQPLGSRPHVLIHRHVHSIDLISHCITQEIHMEFVINSSTQRRLIHHLCFCSHDDAPNTLGFHTFTLCSATGMSNSSDRLSHWIIIWSSSHSLNGWGHLYVPSSVSSRNHAPFLGAFSQVCKLRERLHIAAMIHTSQVCKLENVSHSCNH